MRLRLSRDAKQWFGRDKRGLPSEVLSTCGIERIARALGNARKAETVARVPASPARAVFLEEATVWLRLAAFGGIGWFCAGTAADNLYGVLRATGWAFGLHTRL